jgi:hypothetical protein
MAARLLMGMTRSNSEPCGMSNLAQTSRGPRINLTTIETPSSRFLSCSANLA